MTRVSREFTVTPCSSLQTAHLDTLHHLDEPPAHSFRPLCCFRLFTVGELSRWLSVHRASMTWCYIYWQRSLQGVLYFKNWWRWLCFMQSVSIQLGVWYFNVSKVCEHQLRGHARAICWLSSPPVWAQNTPTQESISASAWKARLTA